MSQIEKVFQRRYDATTGSERATIVREALKAGIPLKLDGYVVRMPSRSGRPCFFTRPLGHRRATDAAYVFPTREEAEHALAREQRSAQFRAPELDTAGFFERLHQAEVVPLPEGVRGVTL